MKPRLTPIVMLFGISLAAPLAAEPLTLSGIGVASCAKLAKDMRPEDGFNNVPNALIYFWAQGYMSAANITTLESDGKYVDLAKLDEKVLLPMIHEYCVKNPDGKPVSLIDRLLDRTDKVSGEWKKGSVAWAAE